MKEAGAITNVPDLAFAAAAPRPAPAPAAPVPQASAPPLVRLVIEEDPASGAFVYKTLDWVTGEVIRQLPREDILKTLRAQNYTAGSVIKTQA